MIGVIQILNFLRIRVLPIRLVDSYRLLRYVFQRKSVMTGMPVLEIVSTEMIDEDGWEFLA